MLSGFKCELVIADPDDISVGEGGAGVDASVQHEDPIGRAQVSDYETASGVDDGGMVAAYLAVGENDVVVRAASCSGAQGEQWVDTSVGIAQHATVSVGLRTRALVNDDGFIGMRLGGPAR